MRLQYIAIVLALLISNAVIAGTVNVTINVHDKKTGKPTPCRIHIKDAAGKPQRANELPLWFDHSVPPGSAQLQLAAGKYTIEIERGPEFARVAESFDVKDNNKYLLKYEIGRLIDLKAEGWWPGDLHVHRPVGDVELLMRAEDLHVAPVITWWNKKNSGTTRAAGPTRLVRFDGNRYYHTMAGETNAKARCSTSI